MLELLASLQRELGLSYLFISHDLAVVRMISHQVHVMQRGPHRRERHPGADLRPPGEEYTQRLVAAVPGTAAGRG